MRKLLAFLVAASLALPAVPLAACTWTTGTTQAIDVCASGNESAPTLATEGFSIDGLQAFTLVAEADTGQTFTAAPAGAIQFYVYDQVVGAWVRAPDLDVTVSLASARRQAWTGYQIKGRRVSRIAVVPVAVTLSAGGLTLYLLGAR
jgi:hypothetical protein